MCRQIAAALNASIVRIDAVYPRSFAGQRKAIKNARTAIYPAITVEPPAPPDAVRLVLVSVTWVFRPATPVWKYVEQTDLTGKQVELVMTDNSRFEQGEIDVFVGRVAAHGGKLVHHVFLRRCRVFSQKSRAELLDEVQGHINATAGWRPETSRPAHPLRGRRSAAHC